MWEDKRDPSVSIRWTQALRPLCVQPGPDPESGDLQGLLASCPIWYGSVNTLRPLSSLQSLVEIFLSTISLVLVDICLFDSCYPVKLWRAQKTNAHGQSSMFISLSAVSLTSSLKDQLWIFFSFGYQWGICDLSSLIGVQPGSSALGVWSLHPRPPGKSNDWLLGGCQFCHCYNSAFRNIVENTSHDQSVHRAILWSRHCCCFFFFNLCPMPCGFLVPRPGIGPISPALEVQSLNRWNTRKIPK